MIFVAAVLPGQGRCGNHAGARRVTSTSDGRWEYFITGTSMNAAAQTVVSVDAVLGTDELRAMVAGYPPGMIELRPWLQPAAG